MELICIQMFALNMNGLGGEGSLSLIPPQVALPVWGVQGGGGGKVEEKGHHSPAGSSGSAVLCPGTVVQSGRSKFKELRDVEVSTNNQPGNIQWPIFN